MMVTRRTAAARQVQFQKIDIHTKVVLGVLAIGAFAALYAIVCGAADLLLFDRIGRGEEIPDAELIAWQVRRDQAGKAVLGTFIFASIAWAAWTFLFLRNAKTLSNAETRYTPIWSTVSIFVPIVNLWYPYAAIMDAAHRSAGAARWWKLVFLWSIVGPLAFLARDGIRFIAWPEANTLEGLVVETWWGVAILVFQVLAFCLTGTVLAELTEAQRRHAGSLNMSA